VGSIALSREHRPTGRTPRERARAARGQAAAPPRSAMNCRRWMWPSTIGCPVAANDTG